MKLVPLLIALGLLLPQVHAVNALSHSPFGFLQTSTREETTTEAEDEDELYAKADNSDDDNDVGTGEDTADAILSDGVAGEAVGSDQADEPADVDDALSIERYEQGLDAKEQYYEEFEDVLDPESGKESVTEFTERIHSMPDYDESIPVLISNTTTPLVGGDVTDNGSVDGELLVLVAPDPNSDEPNPLNRDFEFEEDVEGPAHYEGAPQFVVAGSFAAYPNSSGKVWVIPLADPQGSYPLISGLVGPTGMCFDVNHNFLYVLTVPTILQFEIDWDGGDKFVLARTMYVEVYSGVFPLDCKVDQFGNLIFTEASNQIFRIDYIDLYKGYKNMQYTLYTQDPSTAMYFPPSLELVDSLMAYLINYQETDKVQIFSADLDINVINEKDFVVYTKSDNPGVGLGYAIENRLFYTESSGHMWSLDLNDPEADPLIKSTDFLFNPYKMCVGGDSVYVADYGMGAVYIFGNNDEKNEIPGVLAYLQGAFSLVCVNQV